MLRSVRETAPAGLVPLAWAFAAAAHTGLLAARAVLIGHVVMATLLFAFAALSWSEMREHPVLRAWLAVIVLGFVVTLVGAYSLVVESGTLAAVTVFGWMALPTLAFLYTGYVLPDEERSWAYMAGAGLSGVAAIGFAAGASPLVTLALAGVGQTLGIVVAVVTY
ncbi:hypothetical protein SAMN04487947_0713 [Halogeometricum rufum]|uniref:Uncharacterized protein n=1 Tax=Halogeometricum rufum TaxID=553469 RepID=A0A1I6G824_9EURY|nr:hypothetical protein [Halogeometricum rufum]SFR38353.1 hypothetical protein SAMN04487947_0713 [Halogeometricum rufum]